MAFPKFHGIELAGGAHIKNLGLERLAVDPSPIVAGRLWYNTAERRVKFSSLNGEDLVVVSSFATVEELETALDDSKAYTDSALQSVVGNATPEALDTLKEIAAALNNDPDVYNTLVGVMGQKITDLKAEILGQVSAELDTLGEVEARLNSMDTTLIAADTALGQRITALEGTVGGATGDLSTLTTDAKLSLVAAINEVDAHADANAQSISGVANNVGTLTALATDVKSSLVAAINEVDNHADAAASAASAAAASVGTLTDLVTTAKSSVVAAINEVENDVLGLSEDVSIVSDNLGDVAGLAVAGLQPTVSGSIVALKSALEEADQDLASSIGDMGGLVTTDKNSLVNALNELAGEVAAGSGALDTARSFTVESINNRQFTFTASAAALTHTVTHNLGDSIVYNVMVEGDDGKYRNDIVSVEATSSTVLTIELTESRKVRVNVISTAELPDPN